MFDTFIMVLSAWGVIVMPFVIGVLLMPLVFPFLVAHDVIYGAGALHTCVYCCVSMPRAQRLCDECESLENGGTAR